MVLTLKEKQLLEKLANEGKATKLLPEEIDTARGLDSIELLFIARDTEHEKAMYAVITPKGRKALAQLEPQAKKENRPSRLTD